MANEEKLPKALVAMVQHVLEAMLNGPGAPGNIGYVILMVPVVEDGAAKLTVASNIEIETACDMARSWADFVRMTTAEAAQATKQ